MIMVVQSEMGMQPTKIEDMPSVVKEFFQNLKAKRELH